MSKRAGCRLALIILLLLSLFSTASAGQTDALAAVLLEEGTEPARLDFSLKVDSLAAFDEHRTEQLNQLLSHFSGRAETDGDRTALTLFAGLEEALRLTVNREGGEEQLFFSCAPLTAYTFPAGESPWTTEPESEWMQLAARCRLLLTEGYAFFSELPGLCPEACRETAVNENIRKVGKAKKKVTVSFSKQEAAEGRISAALAGTNREKVKQELAALTFDGAQRAVLYFNGEDQLIKVSFSGEISMGEGTARKVSLEWRCFRTAEGNYDDLTLKTPEVRGNDRDNVVLQREETFGEQETLEISLSGDQVKNRVRTRRQATVSLAWAEQLTGQMEMKETRGDDTALIRVTPEIRTENGKEYRGTLAISRETGKITEEAVTVQLSLGPGEPVALPEAEGTVAVAAGESADSEALQALKDKIIAAVFGKMICLPAEDLGFLTDGIAAGDLAALWALRDE